MIQTGFILPFKVLQAFQIEDLTDNSAAVTPSSTSRKSPLGLKAEDIVLPFVGQEPIPP